MSYENLAVQLKSKIEKIEEENIRLQNQLAIFSNRNYFLENKHEIFQNDIKEFNKIKENSRNIEGEVNLVAVLSDNKLRIEEELNFYKNSNTYKIWVRYRKLPGPIRKIIRSMLIPVKMILRK